MKYTTPEMNVVMFEAEEVVVASVPTTTATTEPDDLGNITF